VALVGAALLLWGWCRQVMCQHHPARQRGQLLVLRPGRAQGAACICELALQVGQRKPQLGRGEREQIASTHGRDRDVKFLTGVPEDVAKELSFGGVD